MGGGPRQAVPVSAEMAEDIRRCLTEVESCFRLLLPLDLAAGLGASLPAVAFSVSEQSAPCQAGAGSHGDEEQPCCSKTLPAWAGHPGAGSGEGPPQTATGAEEEDSDSDEEGFVRRHGLGSHKYTLDVELSSGKRRLLLAGQGALPSAVGPGDAGESPGFLGP